MKIRSFIVLGFYFLSLHPNLHGVPPREIPSELLSEFIPSPNIIVCEYYLDDSYSSDCPRMYKAEEIDRFVLDVQRKKTLYYGITDEWIYMLLDKYPDSVKGKKVGIIGSVIPWYEAIVIAYGGFPVSIEYNTIITDDPRLSLLTVQECEKNPIKFDVILSISSIEHDGLGRYGDPIDPWGDIKAMNKAKDMLTPGGVLFLAVPVGRDALFWNAHRVYGRERLPMLMEGWYLLDSRGMTEDLFERHEWSVIHPVFMLTPK